MLKILMADTHGLIRKGLIDVLRTGGVAALVGEAGTGQETLALCTSQPWDVIILDTELRSGSGLETLAALRAEWPAVPVVMYALDTNPTLARQCLELGAAGYVLKNADPIELICAIEAALSNRIHISQNMTPLLPGIVTQTLQNGSGDK